MAKRHIIANLDKYPRMKRVFKMIALALAAATSCGDVDASDYAAYYASAQGVEAVTVNTLAEFYGVEAGSQQLYKYNGEAVVTYVDGASGQVYLQDATAGFVLDVQSINAAMTAGDALSGFSGVMKQNVSVPTMVVTDGGTVVSQGNVVEPMELTLEQLVAAPQQYVSRLVRVANVWFADVEDGDVFEARTYYICDDVEVSAFELFAGSDLLDEPVPTRSVRSNLTALALSPTEAVLAPRSKADLEEIVPDVPHEIQIMPYYQSFDDAADYDGKSQLPIGWLSTGDMPFVTANLTSLAAPTGTYYMITPETSSVRNEKAYTPFFQFHAGTTYVMTFQLYMPGSYASGVERLNTLVISAGTEQDAEHQTPVMTFEKQSIAEWTAVTVKYTAPTDDEYCFAFNLSSDVNYTGVVAVDDVNVLAEGQVQRPIAKFGIEGGWYDIMTSGVVLFGDAPLQLVNLSSYGSEYEWTVSGVENFTSKATSPAFAISHSGQYTISLTARNVSGERTVSKTLDVEIFSGEMEDAGIMTYNPGDDKYLWYYSQIPTFFADRKDENNYKFDFITGINHYYKQFAERFELPEGQKATIKSMSTYLTAYSRMTTQHSADRNHPFSIAFYGETDGRLDESKCFGRIDSDVEAQFGKVGLGYEHPAQWGFIVEDAHATVEGAFYVAFEFADNMPIESNDPNITRSYVALSVVQHGSQETTIYGKAKGGVDPEFVPDGGWYRLDEIDPTMSAGYGTYLVLWCDLNKQDGMVAIDNAGRSVFDVLVDGDTLHVSGTEAGESVEVYALNGLRVLYGATAAGATAVDISSLPQGVYVVVTSAGAKKFVK